MNTVEKGNQLEELVFNSIERMISSGEISAKEVNVYHHRSYYSQNSMTNIVFDVCIEYRLSDDGPLHRIIIECKNYKEKVNISDIYEFTSKLSSVGPNDVKGIFVTTVGYSEGIINYAKSKSIALIRLNENAPKGFEYIVKREINDPCYYLSKTELLMSDSEIPDPILIYYAGEIVSLPSLLNSYGLSIDSSFSQLIPFISQEDIAAIARQAWEDANAIRPDIHSVLNHLGLVVSYANLPRNCLGRLIFETATIQLSEVLLNDKKRLLFTLAHEIGHWQLHRSAFRDKIDSIGETDISIGLEDRTSDRIEIQANMFATELLMPNPEFKDEVQKVFRQYSINRGRLYVDSQPCNRWNYHMVTDYLSSAFHVSKEAVRYRMTSLKLMEIADSANFYL